MAWRWRRRSSWMNTYLYLSVCDIFSTTIYSLCCLVGGSIPTYLAGTSHAPCQRTRRAVNGAFTGNCAVPYRYTARLHFAALPQRIPNIAPPFTVPAHCLCWFIFANKTFCNIPPSTRYSSSALWTDDGGYARDGAASYRYASPAQRRGSRRRRALHCARRI